MIRRPPMTTAPRTSSRRQSCSLPEALSLRAALGGLLVTTPGCVLAINTIRHTTVNMDNWNVSRITLGLRGDGICPRAPVQLALSAAARHVARDKAKTFETWAGDAQAASRIGKLGFDEFTLTVDGGNVDAESGWFTPNPDVLATASSGFRLEAIYKRQNEVAPAKRALPPSYACITGGGVSGPDGPGGATGRPGNAGVAGQSGGSDASGGHGGDGTGGSQGGNGGAGGRGGSITAWATMVRTPHHARLGMLVFEGDATDVVLFDPAIGYTLVARGGAGGPGGSGGQGGGGGSGGSAGVGGNGGNGGNGGVGGDGGPGGSIVLVVDAEHPELAGMIRLDVGGGRGGYEGSDGDGGSGGSGGSSSAETASRGTDGSTGTDGSAGSSGREGTAGVAQVDRGDVAAKFAGLPSGIEPL